MKKCPSGSDQVENCFAVDSLVLLTYMYLSVALETVHT